MNRPIGVFDSGLGGLTVLKALRVALPSESFVYLGDVARLPYGNKSVNVVNEYSRACARFLESKDAKLVVVACNTATALSGTYLEKELSMPVIGVIQGGVHAALESTRSRKVLVLATDSTVRTEAYLKEFHQQGFQGEVRQLACPLLVPLAEEGWWEHSITIQIIESYLRSPSLAGFEYDTVVLGCTHYPLLEPSFRKLLSPDIALVHGGNSVARQVRDVLQRQEALVPAGVSGGTQFFATDTVSTTLPLLKLRDSLGEISFQTVSIS